MSVASPIRSFFFVSLAIFVASLAHSSSATRSFASASRGATAHTAPRITPTASVPHVPIAFIGVFLAE
jgi:hypothetical protein